MDKFPGKKRHTINLSLFATLSESFSTDKNKSPRNFETGVIGLGIVAAMTDLNGADESFFSAKVVSPKSTPIHIVSLAKPGANFRGRFNSEKDLVVDELSESYTCVISHVGNNLIKKRVYFNDKLNAIDDYSACLVRSGMFSASPMNIVVAEEFCTADFLSSCYLCSKQLHELDIFMYRREKAFCSVECRDKQIRTDDWKDKCRSELSISPCSAPMLLRPELLLLRPPSGQIFFRSPLNIYQLHKNVYFRHN